MTGIGRAAHAVSHPVFWTKAGDGWRYRTMFEEIPLPLDWPVYVSHAEATAYARWAGQDRYRPKSSGTVPHTALRTEASATILGAGKHPIRVRAILILVIGIRRR